jgi:hypothetical protein
MISKFAIYNFFLYNLIYKRKVVIYMGDKLGVYKVKK